jgi:palmitoyltransferase ZDHHC13/17
MASKETHSSGAPIQPTPKSAKVDPQVSSDLELGSLPNGNANGGGNGGGSANGKGGGGGGGGGVGVGGEMDTDIMQMARIGDIQAMEALFETKEYDATYADDEGITALHVRMPVPVPVPASQGT